MRALRTLRIACALAGLGGCGAESAGALDAGALVASPVVHTEAPVSPVVHTEAPPNAAPAPVLDAVPEPTAYDAEAAARAREEAERAAFENEWPLHGVAYHFLAQVRARADGSSPIVGYLRRGSRFRAKDGLRGPGCARGWHEIVGGGYVCRGEGFLLGDRPQSFEPSPVAPALEDALPYPYAYVAREDAPQYWRIPSPEEELAAAEAIAQLRARAEAAAASTAPEGIEAAIEATQGELEGASSAEGEPRGPLSAEPDLEAPPGVIDPNAPDAGAGAPSLLPELLRMRMQRGFYVSIDREESDGERRFFRTVRGSYVPLEVLAEAQPPSMRGVVLGGEWRPPIGFVFRRGVRSLVRDPLTSALSQAEPIEAHTPLLLEEQAIERRGTRYRVSRQGLIVRESALRLVPVIERPAGVGDRDRWIHVDLSEQTLVAYEGDRAVFATLVSSGRAGFETPLGTFRVQSKHVSTTMDDPDSLTDAYSIEDVPWTMYFEGSYALHGAFWHDSFGHPRSHGCVNLAPVDARWLFQWTLPSLPPGWHGVIASARRPGSFVHVTE